MKKFISIIRYSFRLNEYFFTSFVYASGAKVYYERDSIGNKGSILQDNSNIYF
jgi:hypothetical protein